MKQPVFLFYYLCKIKRNYPFTSCKEKKPVIMNTTRLRGMILLTNEAGHNRQLYSVFPTN